MRNSYALKAKKMHPLTPGSGEANVCHALQKLLSHFPIHACTTESVQQIRLHRQSTGNHILSPISLNLLLKSQKYIHIPRDKRFLFRFV